jgi:MFS family permease
MSHRRTLPRTAIRTIAIARAISFTGGAAAFMALNYDVYRLTGSAGWLAATLFLTFGVVGLAGPVAGTIGDRYDRRRVMIASDLTAAALFLAMAFVRTPMPLLGLAFGAALAETPFRAASAAAIPNLIGDQAQLGWANGMVSMGLSAGILLGPVLGGLLVGPLGAQAVFAANACSFVVSALLVATVKGPFRDEAHREVRREHGGMTGGFRFLFRERVLRTVAFAWVAIVLGGGVCMVADVPLAALFGSGSAGYGAMIAGWGGGSLLGSLAGRWVNERNEAAVLVAGALALALGTAAVAASPVFWPVVIAIFVAGFGDAFMAVAEQSLYQRRTPDGIRSRVMAAQDALVQVAMAFAFCFAGLVVALVGPRGAYLVGGATAVVAVLLLVPIRRWTARERSPVALQPWEAHARTDEQPRAGREPMMAGRSGTASRNDPEPPF